MRKQLLRTMLMKRWVTGMYLQFIKCMRLLIGVWMTKRAEGQTLRWYVVFQKKAYFGWACMCVCVCVCACLPSLWLQYQLIIFVCSLPGPTAAPRDKNLIMCFFWYTSVSVMEIPVPNIWLVFSASGSAFQNFLDTCKVSCWSISSSYTYP